MSKPLYDDFDVKIAEQLGGLKATLEAYNKRLDEHIELYNKKLEGHIMEYDSKIKILESYNDKLNIIFGKIGVVTVIAGFVIATVWNFVIDFIKHRFYM